MGEKNATLNSFLLKVRELFSFLLKFFYEFSVNLSSNGIFLPHYWLELNLLDIFLYFSFAIDCSMDKSVIGLAKSAGTFYCIIRAWDCFCAVEYLKLQKEITIRPPPSSILHVSYATFVYAMDRVSSPADSRYANASYALTRTVISKLDTEVC